MRDDRGYNNVDRDGTGDWVNCWVSQYKNAGTYQPTVSPEQHGGGADAHSNGVFEGMEKAGKERNWGGKQKQGTEVYNKRSSTAKTSARTCGVSEGVTQRCTIGTTGKDESGTDAFAYGNREPREDMEKERAGERQMRGRVTLPEQRLRVMKQKSKLLNQVGLMRTRKQPPP